MDLRLSLCVLVQGDWFPCYFSIWLGVVGQVGSGQGRSGQVMVRWRRWGLRCVAPVSGYARLVLGLVLSRIVSPVIMSSVARSIGQSVRSGQLSPPPSWRTYVGRWRGGLIECRSGVLYVRKPGAKVEANGRRWDRHAGKADML